MTESPDILPVSSDQCSFNLEQKTLRSILVGFVRLHLTYEKHLATNHESDRADLARAIDRLCSASIAKTIADAHSELRVVAAAEIESDRSVWQIINPLEPKS